MKQQWWQRGARARCATSNVLRNTAVHPGRCFLRCFFSQYVTVAGSRDLFACCASSSALWRPDPDHSHSNRADLITLSHVTVNQMR
ncbi:unnamed protein product, partial [Iphiclides podalirius]